ncbi:copper resistance protein CopC [Paenibacillus sp. PL91]|uniref:copper resistance protein CopC n=1 Tax=Paenibacillus sp. PL91 TaxID=2729538 RepID=UPI00145EBF21|nr:copper resistance protein CopC [Paenibacillus sp. PL91]MBC9200482.1 copper resistance protein CopC [Paenibacillus sp. PL91]
MPSLVSAHAYIAQSTPYQDAELTESPPAIRITFTEKIDQKLSSITLQREDNGDLIAGRLSGEDDLTLVYTIPKLEKGVYEVSWQVLSLDSHMTDGSFDFAVGTKLEAAVPDDTVSLDGNPAGSAGSGSGTEVKPSNKPSATPSAKPSQTKKPSDTTKAAAATPKPSIAPSPSTSAAPIPTAAVDSGKETAMDTDPGAEAGVEDSGSANEASEEIDGSETTESANDGSGLPDTAGSSQQAISVEEESDHASHGEHEMSSHAEEGEHEHSGGQKLMIALRVLDILAGVMLAGMLFFRTFIWRDAENEAPFGFSLRAERLLIGVAASLWIISGFSRLSMLADQFGGVSIYELANGTMIGKVAALRPILALFVLLLAFAPVRERKWANPLKFAAAAALIITFPLTGHAYAALNDAAMAIGSHAVHMGAAAIWFGGLAGLFSLTFNQDAIDRLNKAAVRFSLWALPSMALILLSGIWLSAARLSAWGQLLSTAYGTLILAKAFFMLLVLVIAALHKLVFMPKIANKPSAARGLLLGIRMEVLLAVTLFVLAGWLSSTSPPAEGAVQKLSEPIYWHVMGEKAHMSLRISADDKTEEQAVRLDVWLPEGLGAPVSASADIKPVGADPAAGSADKKSIPLKLQPLEAELFEFPGFTKYTYRATGEFIDDKERSLMTVDVKDKLGNSFHYERAIGGQQAEE